jgi:hypothetical protein
MAKDYDAFDCLKIIMYKDKIKVQLFNFQSMRQKKNS